MKPCQRDGCERPKRAGKHLCEFHWLLKQSPQVQLDAAGERRDRNMEVQALDPARTNVYPLSRVSKKLWPEGERWCSDCQGFVPLFYCTGSKCRAHAHAASHGRRVKAQYGITRDEYEALLALQGGVCYVCQQRPKSLLLAVDHDHATGVVRGLLCAGEWGCNYSVLGGLETRAKDGGLAAAKRLVDYLEHTPYERLATRGGDARDAGPGPVEAPWPPPDF